MNSAVGLNGWPRNPWPQRFETKMNKKSIYRLYLRLERRFLRLRLEWINWRLGE